MLGKLGPIAKMVGATLTNTANPTMLSAGYKVNVVPQVAAAQIDGRFLPGYEDEFFREVDALVGPGVRREDVHHDIAVETSFDGDLVDAMAVRSQPRTRTAGWFRTACPAAPTPSRSPASGIRCFGFAPLRLPPELDFAGMFHGVDERVPVAALQFGVRVLDNFLDLC